MNNNRRFGRKGAFLMLVIFGFLFLLMFLRVFYIQVVGKVDGHDLVSEAKNRHDIETVQKAKRGEILDRNGSVIATNVVSYNVTAVLTPKASKGMPDGQYRHVHDKEKTAKVLARYLDLKETEILNILMRKTAKGETPYQVEFKSAGRDLPYDIKQQIEKEKLPGIEFEETMKRYYPKGVFASNIIGFTQKVWDEKKLKYIEVGQAGLEKTYNQELAGKDGTANFEIDRWGYLLPGTDKLVTPAKDGDEIYLTIDQTIQSILDNEVSRVDAEYKPESIVAVVANPKTGEILASTQRPTYNPQTGEGINSSWLNQLTQITIEPGSTMKTFTLATAIEKGVWNENATFMSGQYRVGDRVIRDANQVGWGRISYLEGIQRSSNVGMANLLNLIGEDYFLKSIHKFGFGEKTGIDLPKEATGQILDQYKINKVTTTYGQGSTVTPIQLIQAVSAIANDGKMMQPYVIQKIVDPNTKKVVKENKPKVKSSPVSADTAKEVRRILATTITSEKGTAQKFASTDYEVSGKTGTAQVANSSGGYSWGKNQFLYSFLGMAPAKDPKLVMYVAVKKPKLKVTEVGSEPTSKIFNAVMESSLKYLNVGTTKQKKIDSVKIADYVQQETNTATSAITKEGFVPVVIGDGLAVAEQYPQKNTPLLKGNKIFLKTYGDVTLPDFKGWSLRDLLTFKELSGLNIEISGSGYVQKQSVPARTVVKPKQKIKVQLKTPQEQYKKTK